MRKLPYFLILINFQLIFAQFGGSWNHPELKWQYIDTENFRLIFHKGLEKSAEYLAVNGEVLYKLMSEEFNVKALKKIEVVLSNYEDRSNGLATPLGHRIYLYLQPAKRNLTGNLSWLDRVFAHELSHIMNFYAVRKFGFYGELFAMSRMPMWFIEGFAQYSGEYWDNNKDLFLKNFYLGNELLPLKKIHGFPGTDIIESRLVYEQGHSMTGFMAREYGRDIIKNTMNTHRKFPISFSRTIKKAAGIKQGGLFKNWRNKLGEIYPENPIRSEFDNIQNLKISLPVKTVISFSVSPSDSLTAIIGIDDYFDNITKLFIYDNYSKTNKIIDFPVSSVQISWSESGEKLLYTKNNRGIHGSRTRDIFEYDIKTGQTLRITFNQMADDPVYYTGEKIIFVNDKVEDSSLLMLDMKTGDTAELVKEKWGRYFFAPSVSPDNQKVAISVIENTGRRYIAIKDINGKSGLQILTEENSDSRSPVWMDDNNLLFISYKENVPNFYSYRFDTDTITQMTKSNMGFFNPSISKNRIYVVSSGNGRNTVPIILEKEKIETFDNHLIFRNSGINSGVYSSFSSKKSNNLGVSLKKEYKSIKHIKPNLLMPYISKDTGGLQPGIFVYSDDPLAKHTLQTLFLFRNQFNYVINYTNRTCKPTLDFQVYKSTNNRGNFIGTGKLWETNRRWSASLSFPFNFGKDIYSNHILSAGYYNNTKKILEWNRPFIFRFEPWEGRDSFFSVFYSWSKVKPDITHLLNPKEGHSLRIRLVQSLGGDLDYTRIFYSLEKRIRFIFKRNILGISIGGYHSKGDQIIQDRLHIGHPYEIRGCKYSYNGDKSLYGTIYNSFNLIEDIGLSLPLLYVEGNAFKIFMDFGKAWGESPLYNWKFKYGDVDFVKTAGIEFRQRFYLDTKLSFVITTGLAAETKNISDSRWYIFLSSSMLSDYLNDFLNPNLFNKPYKGLEYLVKGFKRYFSY